ncbi:uncharacterized protein LOC142898898 [Nelusetta ayraudi]|uniref:uncharacterized protein LOC142898898 n=1 Tax=Nelusetta ayraudi TaxID=303726 RepID=UPI003F70E2CE
MSNLGACCGVMCGVVCAVLVAAAFPVTQITLGAVYLHECPAGPAVPLYVLVSGVVGLLVISQAAIQKILLPDLLGKIWLLWVVCLDLFALVWFIYGSYHIYVIYQPSYTKPTIDPNGLNKSAYSSPDPDFESPNEALSHFNQTWEINSNLTSPNLTDTGLLGFLSSEVKDEGLKAPQVGSVAVAAPYCNKIVYLFAFWTTTLVYAFAGLGLAVSACLYGCLALGTILASCFST